ILAATCKAAHGQRFIVSDGTTTWSAFLSALIGDRSMASYSRAQLAELHQQKSRTRLVDVARMVVRNQEIRAAARDTRVGELAIATANRLAPAVMQRVRTEGPTA